LPEHEMGERPNGRGQGVVGKGSSVKLGADRWYVRGGEVNPGRAAHREGKSCQFALNKARTAVWGS